MKILQAGSGMSTRRQSDSLPQQLEASKACGAPLRTKQVGWQQKQARRHKCVLFFSFSSHTAARHPFTVCWLAVEFNGSQSNNHWHYNKSASWGKKKTKETRKAGKGADGVTTSIHAHNTCNHDNETLESNGLYMQFFCLPLKGGQKVCVVITLALITLR